MRSHFLSRTALLGGAALAILLGGCGGGSGGGSDGGSAVTSLTVAPSLGKVINADIEARCMPTGVVMGTGSTGTTGAVTVNLTGSCNGPIMVELLPNGSTTYFDEALGAFAALPVGTQLRAMVPSLNAGSTLNLGITPLTELSTRQALATAGSEAAITSDQATSANSTITTTVLGTGVSFDILTPPTTWDANTAAGSLGTTTADRYAFYLAALARLGGTTGTPALTVLNALAADMVDGTLSGGSSGEFIYTSGNLPNLLDSAKTAMATYANPVLQGEMGVAPAVVVSGFSPTNAAVGGSVTITGSGFDIDPFHMLVKFSSNVAATVVSSTATTLVVNVPVGAVTGPITVTHGLNNNSGTSSGDFTVTGGGSDTPTTWVSRASPTSLLLNSLAYGGGSFVAVGYNRTILTSTDGVSWTSRTASDSNYYDTKAVVWNGSAFILGGDMMSGSGNIPTVATSPDGISWTRRAWTTNTNYDSVTAVGVGASKTMVGTANGALAYTTDNGVTWVSETQSNITRFNGFAGNSSTRVAVGEDSSNGGVIIYDTGTGWVKVSGLNGIVPKSVTWTGTMFVAVGSTFAGLGNASSATSVDGISWTVHELTTLEAPAGFPLATVLYDGTTLYATGDNFSNKHVIIQSTDGGSSWSIAHQETVTGNGSLMGIAASPNRVVTVGGVKSVTLP